MKLDSCEKCEYYLDYALNEVICNFWDEITHRITVKRAKEIFVKDCPKEKSARQSVLHALKKHDDED